LFVGFAGMRIDAEGQIARAFTAIEWQSKPTCGRIYTRLRRMPLPRMAPLQDQLRACRITRSGRASCDSSTSATGRVDDFRGT
jgi:hypothetical protein